ncbi:transmembrane protein 106A [Latimeria chalumnae]|uniref:Transmembrane protein 106A n=1 Tax=Latimeria chalumnae TaxID=7897 RepID=H3A5M9_LATCH|nr:PREDICTED: transmembrane protein 106A [Latimeria chalumnae]XP_014352865.1 PREDICTED: transmembrane protein 106A [Latimeria chalumnae]|eukprot:XP_006010536.1 PREDICTED: transmembrane protein 106A [Latimeria chalumnae]
MGKAFSHFKEQDGEKKPMNKSNMGEKAASSYQSITDAAANSYVPYVNIAGRDSVDCPSCQGTGRIPRGQENELVALIPYSDQRLQPNRTKLYVVCAVLCCLIVSALVVFFLFPRSMSVVHAGLNSSLITFTDRLSAVNLNLTNIINVTNRNFYSVSVTDLSAEILHMETIVGKINVKNITRLHPLEKKQLYYTVPTTIQDNSTYKLCTWSAVKVHNLLLHLQVTLTSWYLSHSEQLSFEAYQYVDCGSNTTTPHYPYYLQLET